ncbi:XrtN system VIT domain-containing protein [Flexithrix dorotheae]|uniref:XrtN system VIT domain-containing protein n=1 Tax=Flexithrix dorotheae TaxID=70993 RepID=UPI00036E32FE|nr:XrtN system VIT domain-containing protein [Flexithrix dorotheae]
MEYQNDQLEENLPEIGRKKEASALQKNNRTRMVIVGWVFSVIAFYLFLMAETDSDRFLDFGSLFMINFGIAIVYFLITVVSKFKFSKINPAEYALSLVLFSISAFTLNKSLPVFGNFPNWEIAYIFLMHIPLFTLSFKEELPKWLINFSYFALGMGVVLWGYMCIHLTLFMVYGLLIFWFFGISLHAWVPAIFLLFSFKHISQNQIYPIQKNMFKVGILGPLILGILFIANWGIEKHKLESIIQKAETEGTELPLWVNVSREIADNFVTRQFLLSENLISDSDSFLDRPFNRNRNGLDEVMTDDPLVKIGLLLFGNIEGLDTKDKQSLLITQQNLKHEANRRLWSGNDLKTKEVKTRVNLYHDFRMAYTEKEIIIENTSQYSWRPQEAIYTFHLPTGSTISSLSLWINGREEKAVLTTKGKADKAYETIVGVESRDPALVHWLEGNKVVVTVFPCNPEEKRRFKIGVTSPLVLKEDKLVLQNIYFEGPSTKDTSGEEEVIIVSGNKNLDIEGTKFWKDGEGKYSHKGNYRNYWELEIPAENPSERAFVFDGEKYTVSTLEKGSQAFSPRDIYLDINNSWTEFEINQVYAALKDRDIFIMDKQPELLTKANFIELVKKARAYNYSLFPIHKIHFPENSLVITKTNSNSPELKDLKDSEFSKSLAAFCAENKTPVKFLNIGDELNPYLKTLEELNAIKIKNSGLLGFLDLNKLFTFQEEVLEGNEVELKGTRLKITKSEASGQAGNAPDHLMRLYAYNKIMKEVGKHYFKSESYENGPLIDLAVKANVVSPISSLIALETQKDYDRFDIERSKNSLGNAADAGSGAVPEPHEWALIIFAMLVVGLLWIKKYRAGLV